MGTVTSFKYLGAVVSDDCSKPEVLSRIAQATTALTKLKPIWRDNNISLGSKVKLIRSLVISIFLYACESWTLTAQLEERLQAFEMRCYRRLLNISYKDHVTNEEVRKKIQTVIGEYDELLTLVKKRKLWWFDHVSRYPGLAKTILQGTVKGKEKEAHGRSGGKTISKSGQELTFPAQLGQLKTGQDGNGLLRIHLWCPDDLLRLWDRIELFRCYGITFFVSVFSNVWYNIGNLFRGTIFMYKAPLSLFSPLFQNIYQSIGALKMCRNWSGWA